jgi:hypothetical protein
VVAGETMLLKKLNTSSSKPFFLCIKTVLTRNITKKKEEKKAATMRIISRLSTLIVLIVLEAFVLTHLFIS